MYWQVFCAIITIIIHHCHIHRHSSIQFRLHVRCYNEQKSGASSRLPPYSCFASCPMQHKHHERRYHHRDNLQHQHHHDGLQVLVSDPATPYDVITEVGALATFCCCCCYCVQVTWHAVDDRSVGRREGCSGTCWGWGWAVVVLCSDAACGCRWQCLSLYWTSLWPMSHADSR